MRRLLPSRVEFAIFAVLALIAAACVGQFHASATDLGFAGFAGPIFLFAAVMGLRRSPAWTAAAEDENELE
jgi:hypothetical protein